MKKDQAFEVEKARKSPILNSQFFERLASTETMSSKKLKRQSPPSGGVKSVIPCSSSPPKTIRFSQQSSSCSVSSCSSASTTILKRREIRTPQYTAYQQRNGSSVYDRLAKAPTVSSIKKTKYREASIIMKDRLQSLEKPRWVHWLIKVWGIFIDPVTLLLKEESPNSADPIRSFLLVLGSHIGIS